MDKPTDFTRSALMSSGATIDIDTEPDVEGIPNDKAAIPAAYPSDSSPQPDLRKPESHRQREPHLNAHAPPDRVMREREVHTVTGLSRTTRWRLERAGEFPARIHLSPNAVGWRSCEIADWIASRK